MNTYPSLKPTRFEHETEHFLYIFEFTPSEIEWKDVAVASVEAGPVWEPFNIECSGDVEIEVYKLDDGSMHCIETRISQDSQQDVIEELFGFDGFIEFISERFSSPGLPELYTSEPRS